MAPSPPDRRPLLLVGSILVAVAGIVVLVTSGGSGRGGASAQATSPFSPAPGASPSPTGQPPTQVFSGRDPFQPPGGFATTPPTSFPPISPTSPPVSISPAPPPSQAPGGGSSTTIGGHTVVLDDVFTVGGVQKAQVEVDGVVYTVAEGQQFDDNFKLTNIHGSCADFVFGDQPFTLCTAAHK
jgi:hypothetical protein